MRMSLRFERNNHIFNNFGKLQQPHHYDCYPYRKIHTQMKRNGRCSKQSRLNGWFDNLFPSVENDDDKSSSLSSSRMIQYPEQYPATYEMNTNKVDDDDDIIEALVRPLLKNTQLEKRSLQLVYNANNNGWNTKAFHNAVDYKGAAIVLAKVQTKQQDKQKQDNDDESFFYVGGYNPKGWSSNGGARPSIASFLFYSTSTTTSSAFQKLQKVGGGDLACAKDDSNTGIWFGADGFIVPFDNENNKMAMSKLGTYYERGPKELSSLFGNNIKSIELYDLYIYTGIYNPDEEIPYSGAVLDFTSG